MNQKKAKAIKKDVYGDHSPRFRKYTRNEKGMIIADDRRREYQAAKKTA